MQNTKKSYRPAEIGGVAVENIPIVQRVDLTAPMTCQFTGEGCIKKLGVCSIVKHTAANDLLASDSLPLAALCPNRFKQDGLVFDVIEHLMTLLGDVAHPAQLWKEFALPLLPEDDFAIDHSQFDYFLRQGKFYLGLELQSVYFNGASMGREIRVLRQSDELVPAPVGNRTPDVLSCLKRLWWQLCRKLNRLRQVSRSSMIVAVIDRNFAHHLPLRQHDLPLKEADFVWLIVDYRRESGGIRLFIRDIRFSTQQVLDENLNGTVNRAAFFKKVA